MKSKIYFPFLFFCLCFSFNQLLAQDVITLRNGDDVIGKVREVSPTEIRYNKLENLSGPVYVLSKSEVFMIKYENGSKDVFGNTGNSMNGDKKPVLQQTETAPPANNTVSAPPISAKVNEEEYNHYVTMSKSRLTKGIICTTIGVPCTAVGIALTALGFNALILDDGFDPLVPGSASGLAFLIVGPVLTCVGIPLTIVGPINLGKGRHYAKLAKEKKASLSFEPTVSPNAFGAYRDAGFNGGFKIKLSF